MYGMQKAWNRLAHSRRSRLPIGGRPRVAMTWT